MKKVILLTGATSFLGLEVARYLVKNGHIVYGGTTTKGKVKELGVAPVKLDITSDEECKAAINKVVKNEGRIDVLLNIAGLAITGPTLEFESGDFSKLLDINTLGAFRLSKYAYPFFKKQKSGKIINITSLNGLVSLPNFGLYSASKHALEALGVAMHHELKKQGIFITNLAPGAIYNPHAAKLNHKPMREKFKFLYYLMPMVTKERIAQRILSLIESKNPPLNVIMGVDTKMTVTLNRILPGFIWNWLIEVMWNKK